MKKQHQKMKLQAYAGRTLLCIMAAVMCLTGTLNTQAAAKISSPRIKQDDSMVSGQKVTYDCVYFGNYPQRMQ